MLNGISFMPPQPACVCAWQTHLTAECLRHALVRPVVYALVRACRSRIVSLRERDCSAGGCCPTCLSTARGASTGRCVCVLARPCARVSNYPPFPLLLFFLAPVCPAPLAARCPLPWLINLRRAAAGVLQPPLRRHLGPLPLPRLICRPSARSQVSAAST